MEAQVSLDSSSLMIRQNIASKTQKSSILKESSAIRSPMPNSNLAHASVLSLTLASSARAVYQASYRSRSRPATSASTPCVSGTRPPSVTNMGHIRRESARATSCMGASTVIGAKTKTYSIHLARVAMQPRCRKR